MGFIKGLSIFLLNMVIFVIAIRFITMFLERIGLFRGMEKLFGKRSNVRTDIIEADDVQVNDIDDGKEQE
jgi:hypothetical protein